MRSNRHLSLGMRAVGDAFMVLRANVVGMLQSLFVLRTILSLRMVGRFGGRRLAYSRQAAWHSSSSEPRSEREGRLAS